jgi:hypothetical protein
MWTIQIIVRVDYSDQNDSIAWFQRLEMINMEELIIKIITPVIGSILIFFGGILFADPIKSKLNEWRRTVMIRKTGKIPVRVFLILCPFCSDEIRHLLLRQNRLQSMFELEIAHWEMGRGKTASEDALEALSDSMARRITSSSTREDIYKALLEFCETFQDEMNKYIRQTSQAKYDGINIAITELSFPANYYTWNTKDRKGIVIGIDSLRRLFHEDSKVVNKIILRVLQRMLAYSLKIKDWKVHEATRGCLFDFTRLLTDIQYSVDNTYICKECEQIILRDKDNLRILDDVREWIKNTSA